MLPSRRSRLRAALTVLLGAALLTGGIGSAACAPAASGQADRDNPVDEALGNALAGSASPYLRSAAEQPVHWQPWSETVFALARRQHKPVYLDLGAIWCHWCHVMDRESYEDPAVADLINRLFIPVKVDRDLRPDIDQRYQRAVAALTGASGWPLTAFLTPDGEVFYGGTYVPREQLMRLLPQVAAAFHESPDQIAQSVAALRAHLRDNVFGGQAGEVSDELVNAVVQAAGSSFDARWGGFGDAPKFPPGNLLELLLARYAIGHDPALLGMVTTTLEHMVSGGVHDQLGGRFHRYSTDRMWRVPHFEVMLYDQAEILSSLVHAYAATSGTQPQRAAQLRRVALELMRFLDRSFSDPGGGFYANQDADISLQDDGSYYTWSPEQVRQAVTAPEAEVLLLRFDIQPRGEMARAPSTRDPAQNVLWAALTPEQIAQRTGSSTARVKALLASGTARLLAAREQRPAPRIDRSIYSDWNGMIASAYLQAYGALDDEQALSRALAALAFLHRQSSAADGSMLHAWHQGAAHVEGLLDDQVMVARALLDAYEATGRAAYLSDARRLMDWTLQHLWDEEGGGFFDRAPDAHAVGLLSAPRKPVYDAPSASGNAVAAQVLNRLYAISGQERYRARARATIAAFAGSAERAGISVAALALAAEQYLRPPVLVAIAGAPNSPAATALRAAALAAFRPHRVLVAVPAPGHGEDTSPLLPAEAVRRLRKLSAPAAMVCVQSRCTDPIDDPKTLRAQVATFGHHDAR